MPLFSGATLTAERLYYPADIDAARLLTLRAAWLRDSGRVRYEAVDDGGALAAFKRVAELEGILPALEPAHALAWLFRNPSAGLDLVTLSGRGDKDLAEVLELGAGAE